MGFLSVMVINSCDSIQSSLEVSNTNSAVAVQITKVSPMSAKPNETLSLSGTGFNTVKNPTVRLTMSDGSVKKTSVLVTSSTAASFVMPEGMGLGLKSATLMSGSTKEVTSFKLVADQISNDLPIIIDEQSEICTTKKYIDRNGETQTGTKDCSAQSAKPCAVDGDSNCLVDGNTYKAAAINNLSAGNIKSGITIAGQLGNLTAAVAPNSWDVRVGVTVNGVTGKLKVNCRNRVGSAVFNYDGAISGIGQSAPLTPGTAIDIWDTIDDKNKNVVSGLPPSIVTAWVSSNTSNTDCGGIDTPGLPSDDDNVWKDVTTASTGAASSCTESPGNCTMQDKITGLWWSKRQTAAAWDTAWSTCLTTLNTDTYIATTVPSTLFNSVAGYNSQTGWRLPTQKELKDAYNHGIRSAASSNWITQSEVDNIFLSGSSFSANTDLAWFVNLANGSTGGSFKNDPGQVVCVR